MILLQVKNLTKVFGGLMAVDHVDFTVDTSEILGIIGPNGAGKTTLINMISGFYPPTDGMTIFDGHDITRLKAPDICNLGIGRNFQASNLFMPLPVVDNVYFAHHNSYKVNVLARLLRLPSARREEKLFRNNSLQILTKMGLGHVAYDLTKNLPHGYQRILSICIAIATKPKLLLLDEPMTGMNQNELDTMLTLIRSLRDEGMTIVMIEHNMAAVMVLCERILVLDHGQKIAEGSPNEIQNNDAVIEAYLGRD